MKKETVPWYVLTVFLVSQALALSFVAKAYRRLSERGKRNPLGVIARGVLATRDHFTEDGWRWRNVAVAVSFFGWLSAILIWSLIGTL